MSAVKLRDFPLGAVWIGDDRRVRIAVSVEPRPDEDGHLYWRPLLYVEADAHAGPTMPSLFAAGMPGQTAALLAGLLEDAWDLARSLPEIPLIDDPTDQTDQGGDQS